MRRLSCLTAVLAALALAACGGDEDSAPDTGASGATGAQDASSADFMTAGEFIDAAIPDQVQEVKTIVGITPECEGVDAKPGGDFQVGVAINAAEASPDTPLEDVIADECGG